MHPSIPEPAAPSARIQDVVGRHHRGAGELLGIPQDVRRDCGALGDAVLVDVASCLEVSRASVSGAASFYSLLPGDALLL